MDMNHKNYVVSMFLRFSTCETDCAFHGSVQQRRLRVRQSPQLSKRRRLSLSVLSTTLLLY